MSSKQIILVFKSPFTGVYSESKIVAVVDQYISFIWTETYQQGGNFKLVLPYLPDGVREDSILEIEGASEHMVVNEIYEEYTPGQKNMITVSGIAFFEWALSKRVVAGSYRANDTLNNVTDLLTRQAFGQAGDRFLPGFGFWRSRGGTPDSYSITRQLCGERLDVLLKDFVAEASVGIATYGPYQNRDLYFRYYSGADRAKVVFSALNGGLAKFSRLRRKGGRKTYMYGAGDSSMVVRPLVAQPRTQFDKQWGRNEGFYDGGGLPTKNADGTPLDFNVQIETLVRETSGALNKTRDVDAADGETTSKVLYKYGKDYGLGDIVYLENLDRTRARVRVVEYTFTSEADGTRTFPTFKNLDEDLV